MAGKKTTFIDWRCRECNWSHNTSEVNKRNENTKKELSKFCKPCRSHKTFYRKDTSKGSLGNKK